MGKEMQEKVVRALENCNARIKCKDCPWEPCEEYDCKHSDYPDGLIEQAIELLKAHEPRVVKLEEIRMDEVYWAEQDNISRPWPIAMHHIKNSGSVYEDWMGESYNINEYGKKWRCWTTQPTKEQMNAEGWE